MKLTKYTLLPAAGLLLLSLSATHAAETTPTSTPTPVEMKVTKAYSYDDPTPGLRDRLIVEVQNLYEAIQQNKVNPKEFTLYLDGRALEGVTASPVEAPRAGKLLFELKRTDQSRAAWTELLGSPTSSTKTVTVSVGLPNQAALSSDAKITLRIFIGWRLVLAFILLIIAIILFIWLAKRGYLIHDSNPPKPPPGSLKPYSLGLSQAAFWFFLVIGSFLFIYLITSNFNDTITDQALILIGIGAGTALGAAMIDATKQDTSTTELSGLRPEEARLQSVVNDLTAKQTDLKQKIAAAGANATADDQSALNDTNASLQENQAKLTDIKKQIADAESRLSKPVSENFLKDLLTDVNGITLHRFQIVIWTLVLGFLFILGVYRELAMPQFSTTLLALMGISSGTYLGFKIPERQN